MSELPTGTVTFLFTDIEGSTRLLVAAGTEYAGLLEEHRRVIGQAVDAHGGQTFGTEGDAVFAVFKRATDALAAAASMQRELAQHAWPHGREIRVRAGLHSGEVTVSAGGYVGMTLHEVARISAAAHGGQVLVSGATRELAQGAHLAGLELRNLGEQRLKDLSRPMRLYQLAGPGLPSAFPPLRTMGQRRGNLPAQLSSFVGRAEVEEGRRLLERTRLLTLTGPGGTGKTRLALQLATEATDDFADGAFFVPLDALTDPDLIPPAIVKALGLAGGPSSSGPPLDRVIDHLRERELLLVLDNFEQLVAGVGVVAQLLQEAPRLKVIVTSRTPVRLSGEQEFRIPPLEIPRDLPDGPEAALRSEAVRLFVERATAAQPGFHLTDANLATVVEIVRRLDGLPLAIELAAARVGVLPVEALHDRLDRRLAVLTHGARDAPARQQTLRGAIEWSYDLLEAADRELFERFGVFAGAACLREAEPVCGPAEEIGEDVLDGLASLGEKSLLVALPGAVEPPRFGMLATIREYAGERLAAREEAERLRRRHAEAYLALVEWSRPHLVGSDARWVLDRVEQDHDNVRLAMDWAVDRGQVELAMRMLVSIWRFWQIRGHLEEGWERAHGILALPGVADQVPAVRARALGAAGSIAYWRNDADNAYPLYGEALELARASGDTWVLAEALYNRAFAPLPDRAIGPMLPEGLPYLDEAEALYRALGDRSGLAGAIWARAGVHADAGEAEQALALNREALELYRVADDRFGLGWALFTIATIEYRRGEMAGAFEGVVEALDVFRGTHDVTGIAMCLLGMSMAAQALGLGDAQYRLAAASEHLVDDSGLRLDPALLAQLGFKPVVPPAAGDPGATAWSEGAAMTLDEAVAYALDFAVATRAGLLGPGGLPGPANS